VDEVERRFHRAMISIYETAKRELNYNATRFLQMLSEQGGLVTEFASLFTDADREQALSRLKAYGWYPRTDMEYEIR
jgi:hypothetical protein